MSEKAAKQSRICGGWRAKRALPRALSAILAATACLFTLAAASSLRAAEPGRAVVGYVFPQNAPLKPGQIDGRKLTRINYAFANIQNGRMVPGFANDAANFAYLLTLKRENPSLTVLVSVGGWEWSSHFSDAALTAESRAVFIQSAMEFLTRYGLDGLDIDWEYPGMPGASQNYRSEDKQNFTLLVKELRARFDAETAKTHRKLYLTIAAGATEDFLEHTEMSVVQSYLDTVNLMAYDYYGGGDTVGHHAPLFTNPADPMKISADASVQAYERAGVPAAKIVLGVPFYGHAWRDVPDTNHGLYQSGKSLPEGEASYRTIVTSMLHHGYVRYWDATASAPYLYNAANRQFVSYDDPESLAAKCRYAVSRKLGGIMFWDYQSDPSGELLNAVHDGLNK